MPISQTEGYFENPKYRFLEKPVLFLFTLKWKLYEKASSNVNDTHREKAPSNKTPTLRKSTNIGVWGVGTLNQSFIRGS